MKRMLDAVIDDAAMAKPETATGAAIAATKRCPLRRSRRVHTAPAPSSRLAPSNAGKSSTGGALKPLAAPSKRRRCRHPREIDDVLQEALVRMVFTFLDVRDHQIIRCCSHSWKRLVHSLAVDTLDLSARSPVRSAPKFDHAFLAVMQSYRSVQHLDLSGQRTLADRDLLVLASHFWANLESVRVDDCLQLTDFALFSILNAQSLKLRALSFRHCKQLTGRFANAEIAGKHPSLTSLDLFDTRVDLRFITQVEAAFPSLIELNALHSPAHREWFRQQHQQQHVASPDLAEELRFLMCNQLVELPLLSALITEFERRVASSEQRGDRGGAFHRSLVRAGKRALIDVPLDEVPPANSDSTGAASTTALAQASAVLMACAAGHARSLTALLEVGHAALDVTDREGNTPLCLAASNGHTSALELLLRAGADANARTRSLATPLYLASEHNRDVIVDLLLRHGADPSHTIAGGATALCVAARNGHFSTVQRLLAAILQPPSHHVSSRTRARSSCDAIGTCRMQLVQALFLACESGHTRVVAELLTRAALRADELMDSSVTPLYLACQMGHEAIVTLLLRRGADANFQRLTAGGVSSLYIAAQEGHCAVVEHLVRWKVRVDARMEDQSTALHIAARMGHVDVVRVLIRSGAALDAQTRSGLSPLYIASEEGHDGLVRFLLASGAARDLQTRTGATALFAATQRGHTAVVRVLLMAGASAHLSKHNGTYPTDAAALLGDYDIARLLLQYGARVGALSLHFAERRRDLRLQTLLMSRYFTQHLLLRSGGDGMHASSGAGGGAIPTAGDQLASDDPLAPLRW